MTEHKAFQQLPLQDHAALSMEAHRPVVDIQTKMVELATQYPKVEGLQDEETIAAARELTDFFEVKPSFFEGEEAQARTLILSSYAKRYADIDKDDPSPANVAEKTHVANGVFILVKEHTDKFGDLKKTLAQEAGHDRTDGNAAEVIDKFTQPELTRDMSEKIEREGMLQGVRGRLGITDSNEDPFELHVLSITDGSDTYGIGQKYPEEGWPTSEDWRSDPEAARRQSRHMDDVAGAGREWENGLKAKTEKFMLEYGSNAIPGAFMTDSAGRRFLSVSAPYAEKITYNDDQENRFSHYSEDDYAREFAILEHEYTHTQGGLSTEGVFFGINMEERRAEYFSGDKQGYQDIKAFFSDLRIATGFDITEYFDNHVKGGTREDIYAEVASVVGLDMLVEVLTAVPKTYLQDQSSQVNRDVVGHLGSYEGVIGRLKQRAEADPTEAKAMAERLEKSAQLLADTSIEDFDFFRSYRKGSMGSVHFTDAIADKAEQIRIQKTEGQL